MTEKDTQPMGDGGWTSIALTGRDLSLKTTLFCGQSFRWRPTGPDEWSIGFRGRVISLRQDESSLYYRDIFPPPTPPSDDIKPAQSVRRFPVTTNSDSTDDIIRDYLNLTPDLPALYTKWASGDPNFTKKALIFPGIRILRQDPWETLIGFICSSNNNISRISQMMDKLCIHYGPFLGTVAGRAFHDFPTAAALAGPDVASNLERLGFGYRAKYISKTAQIVANEKGIEWLYGLANPDFHLSSVGPAGTLPIDVPEGGRAGYQTAHEELIQLHGVGPKVADCVCLMGLGWTESVPIDTHVWQIAQRDYKFAKSGQKTLTKRQYQAVADHFRNLWGPEAGWAHSVLFTADLKSIGGGAVKTDETVAVTTETTAQPKVTKAKRTKTKLTTTTTTTKVETQVSSSVEELTVPVSRKRKEEAGPDGVDETALGGGVNTDVPELDSPDYPPRRVRPRRKVRGPP